MPFPHVLSPPALFPTYLIPSLPFRRRTSSTDSNTSTASTASADSDISASPSQSDPLLTGHTSHLRCARCAADLALSSQIISKGFNGRHGRAYLVAPSASSNTSISTAKYRSDVLPNLPNTNMNKPVPRRLVTGAHTVGDISCAQCGSTLGWKYVAAEEEAQRYKVGKFILETKKVCRTSTWENEDDAERVDDFSRRCSAGGHARSSPMPPTEMPKVREQQEIEFDSQDEEECEDLFMGVWTPQLAAKRRRQKRFERARE